MMPDEYRLSMVHFFSPSVFHFSTKLTFPPDPPLFFHGETRRKRWGPFGGPLLEGPTSRRVIPKPAKPTIYFRRIDYILA